MYYYKKNLGDYAKKTARISMLEHGAYTLLIDACYDRERFPTRDEAIDWLCAKNLDEIHAIEYVLRKFFTLEDGFYVQKRIKEEIDSYKIKCSKNKEIAINREKDRATSRERSSTKRAPRNTKREPNQEPLTINKTLSISIANAIDTESAHAEEIGKKRATRLPHDWMPNQECIDFCKKTRPDLNPNAVANEFRDYWISLPDENAKKTNWAATWRNWIRRQHASRQTLKVSARSWIDNLTGNARHDIIDI